MSEPHSEWSAHTERPVRDVRDTFVDLTRDVHARAEHLGMVVSSVSVSVRYVTGQRGMNISLEAEVQWP